MKTHQFIAMTVIYLLSTGCVQRQSPVPDAEPIAPLPVQDAIYELAMSNFSALAQPPGVFGTYRLEDDGEDLVYYQSLDPGELVLHYPVPYPRQGCVPTQVSIDIGRIMGSTVSIAVHNGDLQMSVDNSASAPAPRLQATINIPEASYDPSDETILIYNIGCTNIGCGMGVYDHAVTYSCME